MNLQKIKSMNSLKSLFAIFMVMTCTLSFYSCKDNDDKYDQPVLTMSTTLENNTMTFTTDGGSQKLEFSTNRAWTATPSADWVALSPTQGQAGNVELTITVLPNNSAQRTATVTLTSGLVRKDITIVQAGSTAYDVAIFSEDFNSGLGCWTVKLLTAGSYSWRKKDYKGDGYADISAYKSPTETTKSILVSPAVDFKTPTMFTFQYKPHHAVPGTTLKVVLLDESKNVLGEPLQTIDPAEPTNGFAKTYTDVLVNIPLTTGAMYIGLLYEGDQTHTTGFQVDNVSLKGGEGSIPVNCTPGEENPSPVAPETPGSPETDDSEAVTTFSVDFESPQLPNGWVSKAIEGKRSWAIKDYQDNKYAQMSSFKTKTSDKVMLISPKVNLAEASTFKFDKKVRYAAAGTLLKVVLLGADKTTQLSVLETYDLDTETSDFETVTLSIPANADAKYIAFLYEGDETHTSQVQIDNVKLNESATVSPENPVVTPPVGPTPEVTNHELYFTAYVEGSKFNKYISIYNPSDVPVDLSQYSLKLYAFSKGKASPVKSATLEGTLASKQVIVYKNSKAEVYEGEATALNEIINFNGDDNIALYKGETLIDVIGNSDLNSAWMNDGKEAGKDITLHRKEEINAPSTTFNLNEWVVSAKDDTSSLGNR